MYQNSSRPNRSLLESINEKLLNSYEIRPFPQVVVKLVEALRDPNIPLENIRQIVLTDAALCAKVLKMSNSPLIGAGQRIADVDQAIMVLGFSRIKSLAQTHAAAAVMSGDGSFHEVRRSLWQHSLACATACRVIANRLNVADPSQAFLAGVFHDVGHVFFLDLCGESYVTLRNAYHPLRTVSQEQGQFGLCHQEAGMKLGLAWGLPEPVRVSIGYHHRPEQAIAHEEYAWIVYLADRIVHSFRIGSATASIMQADYKRSPFYLTLDIVNSLSTEVISEYREFQQAYS